MGPEKIEFLEPGKPLEVLKARVGNLQARKVQILKLTEPAQILQSGEGCQRGVRVTP